MRLVGISTHKKFFYKFSNIPQFKTLYLSFLEKIYNLPPIKIEETENKVYDQKNLNKFKKMT